jgi:alpha-methylacyl-CoA racemase
MKKPLDGIRVLDLTRLLPGPLCTQHLADMGADVIKVEDTGQGDYARNMRGYYRLVNRNKRSLRIDLKHEQGKSIFFQLVKTADVLFEGFRPGVVDRLGIDYQSVRELNPGIVYCSLSGYGQDGPYRLKAGHDLNYCSEAGITEQIGQSGSAPAIPNLQIADFLGGTLSSAMGILAALVDVQRSGQGRYVDVAMADCVMAHSIVPMMEFNETGKTSDRGQSFLSGGLPWYSIYQAADGKYIALGALEQKFWQAFCDHIDRPDWTDKQSADVETLELIREQLRKMFRGQTQQYWVDRFRDVDCCLSAVAGQKQVVEHEQFQARGMIINRNEYLEYGFPLKFSDFEFEVYREPPAHGEHTNEILTELGYGPAELKAAKAAGAV